ncbi:hypothetical protein MHY_06510 [Megamonas hypermegale ART12/1]|nr:hypothetical protein MHY_06510 [Megamonas hypermegale ART12/1]
MNKALSLSVKSVLVSTNDIEIFFVLKGKLFA